MKPILFNGEMVRAILEGRKTQTRRVVKPQPECSVFDEPQLHWVCGKNGVWADGHGNQQKAPLGQPGDRLYVRETWALFGPFNNGPGYRYRADGEPLCMSRGWRPSIHMPKEAARIFLEITAVRVERLQDISEEDAKAEGCELVGWTEEMPMPAGFAGLWNSLNGKRGHSWESNPWVWVYEFTPTNNQGEGL